MKKVFLLVLAFMIISTIITSCKDSTSPEPDDKLEEIKSENEIKIGNQIWMAKNLDVDKFRNGDPIPEAKTNEEWQIARDNKQPAWCYYDNDPANGVKYGKLYNWYAVNDPRGLAPAGWQIPSDDNWKDLTNYLGSDNAKKLKSSNEWDGTNSTGFNALPSGLRGYDGDFFYIGNYACWWNSTDGNSNTAWFRSMQDYVISVLRYLTDKAQGFSVRCIKD